MLSARLTLAIGELRDALRDSRKDLPDEIQFVALFLVNVIDGSLRAAVEMPPRPVPFDILGKATIPPPVSGGDAAEQTQPPVAIVNDGVSAGSAPEAPPQLGPDGLPIVTGNAAPPAEDAPQPAHATRESYYDSFGGGG